MSSASFSAAAHNCLRDIIASVDIEPAYARLLDEITRRFEDVHPETLGLIATACEAAGGSPMLAMPVGAAWRALHIAARLLDDAEDGDVAHWQQGDHASARLTNLGTGFISLANLALAQLDDPARYQILSPRFHQIILIMAGGQHLDLLPRGIESLDAYWRHVKSKSGAFFGLAVEAGACCGGADDEALARYHKFGYNLGVSLQLLNDLIGFFQEEGHSDLAAGKRTLPFFYLADLAPTSVQTAIENLFRQASQSADARQRLRKIAREHGADAYVLAEIFRYAVFARHSLNPQDDPAGGLTSFLQQWLIVPDEYLAQ